MAQLLIRDLEPAVIARLKLLAKKHHRSLQGELKLIVETAAKISAKEIISVSKAWHKRLAGHSFSDSAKLLREDRDR